MSLRYILFASLLLVGTFAHSRDLPIKTIVIDAGHGGKDPGASGPGHVNEKDIALSVALKLGDYISKSFPEIKVIYTRKTDEFIELHERAEIANKAKADLFIAIHCNASPNSDAYGTSTYVLGLHRTEANLEVAKRENSVILMEDDRAKNYDFDPNSAEGHIIMSMKQNAFLDQSIDMASKIENQYEDHSRRKSLGVKQAGFYVLYKTTMPSLLSEIGFISNPDEEKFLNSTRGQDQIAESLFNAFKQYKAAVEIASGRENGTDKPATTTTDTPKTSTTTTTTTTEVKTTVTPATPKADDEYITLSGGKKIKKPTENIGGGGKVIVAAKPEPVKVETPPVTPAEPVKEPTVVTTTTTVTPNKEEAKPPVVETKTEVKTPEVVTPPVTTEKKEVLTEPVTKVEPVVVKTETKIPAATPTPVKIETKPVEPVVVKTEVKTEVKPPVVIPTPEKKEPAAPVVTKAEPVVPKTTPTTTTTPAKTPDVAKAPPVKPSSVGYNFKLQLFALKGELKQADREKIIKLFKEISEEPIPSLGMTRYYAGNTGSYSDAKKMAATAVNNGYPGAFIIGTKDGKRMSADDLKALDAQ